jgi:hypothetical protein
MRTKSRVRAFGLLLGCCFFSGIDGLHAAPETTVPNFQEVYQAISTNLGIITSNELDRAAVEGLIDHLAPRVTLASQSTGTGISPLAQARLFDQGFAYFRIASVNSKLPDAFRAAYQSFVSTNSAKIKGLVLDLRFARGTDYSAAAKMADYFLNSEEPLLDWQQGSAKATKKTDAILAPVAILINSQTTGAAAALAAVLRQAGVGLVLGNPTVGGANVFKEIPLSNGDTLRIAVGDVSVGDGKTLSGGVKPDIAIDSNLQDEKIYLQDPYKDLHPGQIAQADATTNVPAVRRPRFNEAELVREHKAGEDTQEAIDDTRATPEEPSAPIIADPVLARALDLLKGLAVVQPSRPG